jgi:hypothetical protein
MIERCPCCGQDIPPALKVTGTVRQRAVNLIAGRRNGISLNELIELIYADRPNGEPDFAASSIKTTIHYANRALQPQGYRIRSTLGPGARYRLERLLPPANA